MAFDEFRIGKVRDRLLPAENTVRKEVPVATGVLDYFPAALAEVARVSMAGNLQHNGPTAPLVWSRDRGKDQENAIVRHFLERGGIDSDGIRHSAKLAWRALALLQLELENAGAPMARGARLVGPQVDDPRTPQSTLAQNAAAQYNPHSPYQDEPLSPRELGIPSAPTSDYQGEAIEAGRKAHESRYPQDYLSRKAPRE